MKLPDFFIIGAAKSGTTSLHALLEQHSNIFMPTPKEPEFFARDDLYAKGLDNYARLFEAARPDMLIGEASTIYSLSPFFPDTAARISKHVPHAKIIYIMREPVERAYSYYVQLTKNYQKASGDYVVHRSFEDFIFPERRATAALRDKALAPFDAHLPDHPDLCLAGSDYVKQIQAYLKYFEPDRILFLTFEQFVRDETAVLQCITDFLGVAPLNWATLQKDKIHQNKSSSHFQMVHEVTRILDLKKKMGPVWRLRKMLPFSLRLYLRRIALYIPNSLEANATPAMENGTRQILAARFDGQIDELSDLTGLDLSAWKWTNKD